MYHASAMNPFPMAFTLKQWVPIVLVLGIHSVFMLIYDLSA